MRICRDISLRVEYPIGCEWVGREFVIWSRSETPSDYTELVLSQQEAEIVRAAILGEKA